MFWKNKKVVITGAAGFIGSNLSNELSNLGAKVIGIDNLERGKKIFLNKKVKFVKYDLRKKSYKLNKIFKNSFVIFHLASKVGGMNYYLDNQFEVMKDNIAIDNNVLETAATSNVKNYFYASSSHIYPLKLQSTKKVISLKEEYSNDSHPVISYGWSKLIGEKQIGYLNKKFKSVIIARYVGIFGPNQDANIKNGSLIPVLSHRAIKYPDLDYKVLSRGDEVRSYCYITDAIECTKLLVEKFSKKNYKENTFNICSSEYHSVKEISKMIVKISKKKISIKYNKNNKANILTQFCSNQKIKKAIGWKPKINFFNGLKIVYNDIKKRYEL